MDYWVDAAGENAIWYQNFGSPSVTPDRWQIGLLSDLWSSIAYMYTKTDVLEMKCPNNEGYYLSWMYWNHFSYITTNDVYIKCVNEDDFCTSQNPCAIDEGDCDIHDECQMGLVCGTNNCPELGLFNSDIDCCYNATIGDKNFCTQHTPCGTNEGDCDIHNECHKGLACGTNNCPESALFNSDVDCCYNATIGDENFCTYITPCGTDEGDCDTHDECQDDLFCGSNNCLDYLGFHSDFDCCYTPTLGDQNFCTTDNPCAEDEGDCDSNNECQSNLICDIANSCHSYLEFASDMNCCLNASGCKYY